MPTEVTSGNGGAEGPGHMPMGAATRSDRDAIREVHRSAFGEDEREIVRRIAVDLLSDETTPPTVSLVAATGGRFVGHVVFSPVTAAGIEGFQGYILAPLAVLLDHQRRHIGSLLVESGRRQLSAVGTDLVLVYGDPEYYGRSGFRADVAGRWGPHSACTALRSCGRTLMV